MNPEEKQPPSFEDLSPKMKELLGFREELGENEKIEIEKNYTRMRALLCLQGFTANSWINKTPILRWIATKADKTQNIFDLINEEFKKYEEENSEEKQQKILRTIERRYLSPVFKNAVKNEMLIANYYATGRPMISFKGDNYSFITDGANFNAKYWEYDDTVYGVREQRKPGQNEYEQKSEEQGKLGKYIINVMERWNNDFICTDEISDDEEETELDTKPRLRVKMMPRPEVNEEAIDPKETGSKEKLKEELEN